VGHLDADSKVTAKGVTWPIAKLLDGSPYQDAFKNGIYIHSFLNVDDYHRYHVPVAGEIKVLSRCGSTQRPELYGSTIFLLSWAASLLGTRIRTTKSTWRWSR
jgi:hypothetical protein